MSKGSPVVFAIFSNPSNFETPERVSNTFLLHFSPTHVLRIVFLYAFFYFFSSNKENLKLYMTLWN